MICSLFIKTSNRLLLFWALWISVVSTLVGSGWQPMVAIGANLHVKVRQTSANCGNDIGIN